MDTLPREIPVVIGIAEKPDIPDRVQPLGATPTCTGKLVPLSIVWSGVDTQLVYQIIELITRN